MSAKRDLRNIIFVLSAAVLCAVALSAYMIYYYGPTGRYLVSNALIAPDVAHAMDYRDYAAAKGKPVRYVLNGFHFSYYDAAQHRQQRIEVDPAAYSAFYAMISGDKSLEEVSSAIMSRFEDAFVASLTITVRPDDNAAAKVFQTVQLASKGDYFRIQLHQQGGLGDWVYFYHPGIYDNALKIFGISNA